MSRSQLTILTNICLIERSRNPARGYAVSLFWNQSLVGYAFPGGHVGNGRGLLLSLSFVKFYEETGLTIQNPQLVGIKNWPLVRWALRIVFVIRRLEFSGTLRSSDEGEVSWVQKTRFQTWIWPMICYLWWKWWKLWQVRVFLPSQYRRRLGKEISNPLLNNRGWSKASLDIVVEILSVFGFN